MIRIINLIRNQFSTSHFNIQIEIHSFVTYFLERNTVSLLNLLSQHHGLLNPGSLISERRGGGSSRLRILEYLNFHFVKPLQKIYQFFWIPVHWNWIGFHTIPLSVYVVPIDKLFKLNVAMCYICLFNSLLYLKNNKTNCILNKDLGFSLFTKEINFLK